MDRQLCRYTRTKKIYLPFLAYGQNVFSFWWPKISYQGPIYIFLTLTKWCSCIELKKRCKAIVQLKKKSKSTRIEKLKVKMWTYHWKEALHFKIWSMLTWLCRKPKWQLCSAFWCFHTKVLYKLFLNKSPYVKRRQCSKLELKTKYGGYFQFLLLEIVQ